MNDAYVFYTNLSAIWLISAKISNESDLLLLKWTTSSEVGFIFVSTTTSTIEKCGTK